jgi:hypothetical protein
MVDPALSDKLKCEFSYVDVDLAKHQKHGGLYIGGFQEVVRQEETC